MSDDIDNLMATARRNWHAKDVSGRVVHALCDEIDRLRIWSSESHVTDLEAEVEQRDAEIERLILNILDMAEAVYPITLPDGTSIRRVQEVEVFDPTPIINEYGHGGRPLDHVYVEVTDE